jgi:hypothetical protein
MSLASALTFTLVSLPTIATAQTRQFPNAAEVPAPPLDARSIEPSKVTFLLAKDCRGGYPAPPPNIYGIASREIDLSDDLTAMHLLQMGIAFGNEKCPSATDFWVTVRPGDPTAFTDPKTGFEFVGGNNYGYPTDVVDGGWSSRNGKSGVILAFRNWARASKEQQMVESALARQRNAELESIRQADQEYLAKCAAIYAAFIKTNGVGLTVTADQLAPNPFVYQGRVVAITGTFEQMNSASLALFASGSKHFVVSRVPAGKFKRHGSAAVIAGRVVGNIEVKLPVIGPTLVPEIAFVGCVFCPMDKCSDYPIR